MTLDLRGQTFDQYLRVSRDRSGQERSNHEQHADNGAFLADYEVAIGRTYSDVGSASQFARKPRGDFAKLIDDLERGRFPGSGLAMWEGSRGSRDDVEWSTLLRLLARRGKLVAVTSVGRFFDPSDDYDYDALMRMALDARMESAKTSKRVRRNAVSNAANGRPHGIAPYGYMRRYDEETGRVRQEVEPTEAALLADAFERVAAGHSLRTVASDLAGSGVVGRRGAPMRAETLRPMLLSATYIGRRVHAPGSKSRSTRQRSGQDVFITDGDWPGIVSEATFYAVKAKLTDPSRRTSRPGRGVHLLSMIARCDVCGGVLAVRYARDLRQYWCHGGSHVRIGADDLDRYAEDEMFAWLSRSDVLARIAAEDGDDAALADARDSVGRIRAELDDLADSVGRGDVSATLAARAEPAILARLRDAETLVEDLSTPSSLRGLLGADISTSWRDAPMSTRREVARTLLSPAFLGELRVGRAPTPGRPCPVEDRVQWGTPPPTT